MKKYFFLTILITLFLIISSILLFGSEPFKAHPTPESRYKETSFMVDGVELTLSTPFFPNQKTVLPNPGDPVQAANFFNREPIYSALTLTAIPFGTRIGSEIFPTAGKGIVDNYRDLLWEFRKDMGGLVQAGPVAELFGLEVPAIFSTIPIYIHPQHPTPVAIAEWIFEGGERIWILRLVQEVPSFQDGSKETTSDTFINEWAGVNLSSTALNPPTTVYDSLPTDILDSSFPGEIELEPLPFPYWWDGDCDTNTYQPQAGVEAYPLGGSYRGVEACGPRPWFDEGPDVLVQFYEGAWGVLEWQCVELSMRFLHLAFGVPPYKANGNLVVPNYNGDILVKVDNGTPGKAPHPNDVMSSGPETTYGHTAIVIESNVDSTGNGTITVLEQNSSESGIRSHNVVNWELLSNYTVIGWLHDPSGDEYISYFPFIH